MFKGKNMKKGFTLIELMSVILILGIISTVTIASINYSIKQSKEKLYVEQVDRLESRVKDWAISNTDLLPINSSGIIFFDVTQLLNQGIIDTATITDPRTGSDLSGCVVISFDDTYNQYGYEYVDTGCSALSDSYKPVITISGGLSQFVEVNSLSYQVPSATATTHTGNEIEVSGPIIKQAGNVVTELNLSTVGTVYTLTYTAIDPSSDLVREEVVTLTVNDTIAPVIVIGEERIGYTITQEAGASFARPEPTITDNSCGLTGSETTYNNCLVTLTYTTSGTFTPTVPGTYTLTYRAEDSSANVKFFVVTLIATDTVAPDAPTYVTRLNTSAGALYNGTTTWTNQNVWIGNLLSVDAGSGIKLYEYSVNCTGTYTAITPNGTNNYTHTVAADSVYNGNICLRAQDNVAIPNIGLPTLVPVKIDKKLSTVSFGTNGTSTFVKNASTTVTVADADSGVNSANLKYLWTTSATAPADGSFTSTFASGDVINSTANLNGTYYLWIYIPDNAGNITKLRSNAFKFDNIAPVLTIDRSSGKDPYAITVGDNFIEPGVSATDASGVTPIITTTYAPAANPLVRPVDTGTYTITYRATDEAGNYSTGTRAFYIWTPWSGYIDTVHTASATKEVLTRLQYSYRDEAWCVNPVANNATAYTAGAWGCGTITLTGNTGTNYSASTNSDPNPDACSACTQSIIYGGTAGEWISRRNCNTNGAWSNTTVAGATIWVDYHLTGGYNWPGNACIQGMLYKHSTCVGACVWVYSSGTETRTFNNKVGYWGAWSGWSGTAATASATKQVQTKTQYNYRTR